jgi:hypothetical protein
MLLGPSGPTPTEDVALVLNDDSGPATLALDSALDGKPNVRLIDNGKLPAGFGLSSKDRSQVQFLDNSGKARASFGLDPDGRPSLIMMDDIGTRRVNLGMALDGTPSLALYDKTGSHRERIPTNSARY